MNFMLCFVWSFVRYQNGNRQTRNIFQPLEQSKSRTSIIKGASMLLKVFHVAADCVEVFTKLVACEWRRLRFFRRITICDIVCR